MYKLFLFLLLISFESTAQNYWQQHVKYDMDIELNVKKNCMDGYQTIIYQNNSPDEIDKVFYHLYFNAFQPNSMMDQRSRTIIDPDPRVADRILGLNKKEIGYHDIKFLKQDGRELSFEIEGTILIARLLRPVGPGESTILEMEFESQVPVQIRRSGRDNKEGIEFSMAQWYPKICEYDEDGWHPNPYIAREFYGVWGDYDVTIEIDSDYKVAAGGVLLNDPLQQKGKKRSWHFLAENVHDFVWAADPDYTKDTFVRKDGIVLEFHYQPGERTTENWKALPAIMDKALDFINEKYGKYPFPLYAFIQGGDGGMEYPMATLITGERSLISLVGVSVHELMHSWYQMIFATNESLYPWMDEGFTSFSSNEVMNYLKAEGYLPGYDPLNDPHGATMTGYRNFAKTPLEEPLTTHADHYDRNQAHGIAAYVKGSVFLNQLGYVIGRPQLDQVLLDYYDQWALKHPDVDDFIRVAEKRSDMILDWYKEQWVNTTNKIDYAIDSVYQSSRKKTMITLSNKGRMMMPVDLWVYKTDGEVDIYNIPLRLMRGHKEDDGLASTFTVVEDWPWTQPVYELEIKTKFDEIKEIRIDQSNRMADIDLTNNTWPKQIEN